MTSTNPAAQFFYLKTQAACRRAQQAQRDALVAELGWAPEGVGDDRYMASTLELVTYANEKRAAAGLPLAVQQIFTVRPVGMESVPYGVAH